jgi:adducin
MKVLILRNHGLVAMGGSIEEAFHITQKLVKACEIQVNTHVVFLILLGLFVRQFYAHYYNVMQVAVMSAGLGNINQCSQQGVWSGISVGVACMGGVGGACSGSIGSSPRKWRIGELEFEALMRMLDNKVRY